MTEAELAAVRARLGQRLAELDALSAASAQDRAPVELDQTAVGRLSRMDSLQVQAMAAATQQRRMAERARIVAALARLEAGEFGWCVRCGEPIAAARLSIDETTPTCVACAG